MKGLLFKELYNLEKQARSLLLVFAFYLFFSLIGETGNMFGGVVFIMMVMLVITSLAYDERSRWDRYALTMPVSRKEIVLSKYLLGLILLTFALLINIIFLILFGSSPLGEVFILTLSLFGIGLVSLSIILPLMYKYGVENGRLLLILVLFVPMAAVLLIVRMGLLAPPGETFIRALPIIIPGILVLVVSLSILVSLRIYQHKDM
jgi:ABC-2 type transport system permease protein